MKENRNIEAKAVLFTVNKVSCISLLEFDCERFCRMWWAHEDYNRPSALVLYCYICVYDFDAQRQRKPHVRRSFVLAITELEEAASEMKAQKKK